jgi:hypothetical protein
MRAITAFAITVKKIHVAEPSSSKEAPNRATAHLVADRFSERPLMAHCGRKNFACIMSAFEKRPASG